MQLHVGGDLPSSQNGVGGISFLSFRAVVTSVGAGYMYSA
jgi:hypothetical protein